ncbi:MAG: hypothetical protein WBQ23_07720 [Bacteroidota bacterium]
MTERLSAGAPRASLLFLNFEDERLTGLDGAGLQWLLEEYYLLHPTWRGSQPVPLLITLDAIPPRRELPAPLQWSCVVDWLLDFSF